MEPTADDWAKAREQVHASNRECMRPFSNHGYWKEIAPGADTSGSPICVATVRLTGFRDGYMTRERDKTYMWVETPDDELTTDELEELQFAISTAQNEWGGQPDFPNLYEKLGRMIERRKSARTVPIQGNAEDGFYVTISGPVNHFPPI